jgi:hypothetical protein
MLKLAGCICNRFASPGFVQNAKHEDEEQWKCPCCGQVWVYVHVIGQGFCWVRQVILRRRPTLTQSSTDRR